MKRLLASLIVLILLTLACVGPAPPGNLSGGAAPTPSRPPVQPPPPVQPSPPAQQSWAANLVLAGVDAQTGGGLQFASASRLLASWQAPAQPVDHYQITATQSGGSAGGTATAPGDAVSLEIGGLKSATTYEVSLLACLNADGSQRLAAGGAAFGSTSEEYWQIQGEGNSYETATKVVEGGNNIPYVLVWGLEAGPGLAGKAQLYYHPFPRSEWSNGIRIAVGDAPAATLSDPASFTPTMSGLQQACDLHLNSGSCPPDALLLATFQAVPLAWKETIRLYFEAQSADRTTRIYYLDSQDGYLGQDFSLHPDSTVCNGPGSTDYGPGGDCEPTLAVGVEGDPAGGDSGLIQARQFKIGYPKRDSWAWDGAPGTFMVITGADACGATQDGLFAAAWDGEHWQVEKDAGGCAVPLVLKAHGPVLMHLGERHYKLYYEDATAGRQDKPFRMIYADGTLTGDPESVEFGDWENAASQAREVHFLWPSGDLLDAAGESGLGDHMILLPTNDPAFQVMYVNLGGLDTSKQPGAAQGIGIAVLLNP